MSILKSNNADYRTVIDKFLEHISVINVRSIPTNGEFLAYSSGLNNQIDFFCKPLCVGCMVIYLKCPRNKSDLDLKVGVIEGFTNNRVTVSFVESQITTFGLVHKKVIKHLNAVNLIRTDIKTIQSLTGLKYEYIINQ